MDPIVQVKLGILSLYKLAEQDKKSFEYIRALYDVLEVVKMVEKNIPVTQNQNATGNV